MKTLFFVIISLFVSAFCLSQNKTAIPKVVADSGKYEFKLQAKRDTPNYLKAYRILANQVKLNPKNAELRYFLGYAIDRLNADDGKGMFQLEKGMTIKASEQFEEVNRLEPIYKGEQILLDPYSKITSVWGSLAEAYLNRKLPDSAKWAFTEGKKRGGFIEPILEFNRQLLNSCAGNSILVTYGDNITIPIWYLQTIENLRNDITAVDANLINTTWYPKYLKSEKNLKISLSDVEIDTVQYMEWKPQNVEAVNLKDTTQKLMWELRPTYLNSYILKGDRILLDIFQQNFFNRPMYFSSNSDTSYNLFLSPYLVDQGLVAKVSNKPVINEEDTIVVLPQLKSYSLQNIKGNDILKSRDAIIVLGGFRWAYYSNISHLVSQLKFDRARELIKEMTRKFPKEKLPFFSEDEEKYFDTLFKQADKNYR